MKKSIFPILGILVAIIGIGAPILWDTLRSKQSLEIQIVSSISLLENDPIMDKLEIRYEDKKIQDLTKFIFVLINSGRRPIVEEHVKHFPTIVFGRGTEILSAEILRTDPKLLETRIDIDTDTLAVKFPLLNPTDFIEFCSYVSGYSGKTPQITSRVQGIKSLTVVNKTLEVPTSDGKKGWIVLPVGIFTAFCGLILCIGFIHVRQQLHARRLVREDPDVLNKLESKEDFEGFVDRYLGFILSSEKRPLQNLLAGWNNSDQQASEIKDRLRSLIRKRISEFSGAMGGFFLVLIFTMIGLYYLLMQLVF